MTHFNLQGLRVLNTRPTHQAEELNLAITRAKGVALSCPALIIKPIALNNLPHFTQVTLAIFTSANAVNHGISAFAQQKIKWPSRVHVIAVGNGTARALEQQGIRVDSIPSIADSEHLLMLDSLQDVQHKTILLFKGEGGRSLITTTLKERGAQLIVLDVYQRIMPAINREQLDTWWRDRAVDIILITSEQAMQNIFTLFGEQAHAWLKRTPCLVISKRLAEAAFRAGMQKIIICSTETIIDALHQFNKGLTHGKEE
ncbi:MAG: uroporphyrinogen-III synthase [Legionella sp.]|nr:uroporphyrinogen-III synthase [Legionella sp.]